MSAEQPSKLDLLQQGGNAASPTRLLHLHRKGAVALESVSAASLHGPLKQIRQGAQKVHAQGCNTNGQLLCTQQSLFVRITFCVVQSSGFCNEKEL